MSDLHKKFTEILDILKRGQDIRTVCTTIVEECTDKESEAQKNLRTVAMAIKSLVHDMVLKNVGLATKTASGVSKD